ncbi:hypothetical protein AAGU66_12040 [Edwardsiella ictaluri]|uniref:hypothetical protein n=1 Tax=Edwardsiella ictaluri TaxID=67780 RepID=UPI00259C70E6|nr:hypothetical protein [Edwardsiella ictaluri]WJH21729.1 hypothetical protein FGU63_12670 [Edwardsiella ictaluri]
MGIDVIRINSVLLAALNLYMDNVYAAEGLEDSPKSRRHELHTRPRKKEADAIRTVDVKAHGRVMGKCPAGRTAAAAS